MKTLRFNPIYCNKLVCGDLLRYSSSAPKQKAKGPLVGYGIIKKRSQYGTYNRLVRELQQDETYPWYFRLSREQFAQVLFYVEADLVKHCMSR